MTCSILVQFRPRFFSIRLVNVHVVHPYSRSDTNSLEKLHFILSDRFDIYMIDNLSIADHAFAIHKLISFSLDDTLHPMYVNLFINFREAPFSEEMYLFFLSKHRYPSLSAFSWKANATCCLLQTIQQGFGLVGVRGSLNMFPNFFRMGTFIDSPLRSNLLRLQCTCCTVPTTSGRPHWSSLVWACQSPPSQPLSSPQLSHNDSLWA